MADIFSFPDAIDDRPSVTAMLTPRPTWDEPRVAALLAAFGMREVRRRDRGGPRLVATDERAELEIFRTSDSLRWTARDASREEPAVPPALPGREQALAGAAAALAQRGLTQPEASVASVTESVHARIGPGNEVLARHPVAVHVNHEARLEGLPVFGPGAKVQVTFREPTSPAQLYVFWRNTSPGPARETIGYARAVERLRRHPTFASMVAGGRARVAFDEVQLGYYAFPPREVQGMLVPVYRFRGRVAIPDVPEPHVFYRYVVAVGLQAADVKRLRVTARGSLPAVFSA